MKKLKLDDLAVESFTVTSELQPHGTVLGASGEIDTCHETCGVNRTCWYTCGNQTCSLTCGVYQTQCCNQNNTLSDCYCETGSEVCYFGSKGCVSNTCPDRGCGGVTCATRAPSCQDEM